MNHKLSRLAIAIAAAISATNSQAVSTPYLLTINDANPSAVVITATGAFATANSSTITAANGIDLLGFFSQSVSYNSISSLTGSLTAAGVTPAFNFYQTDNDSTGSGSPYHDLNLYLANNAGSSSFETFSTSQAAFTGTWTINLSSFGGTLPTTGAAGSIFSGNAGTPGAVVGQWQVVPAPEPSTIVLFTLGALMFAAVPIRRRYSSRK